MEDQEKPDHLKRVTTRIKGPLKKAFNKELHKSGEPESVVLRKILRSYFGLEEVKA
jgi:hypothetical protein